MAYREKEIEKLYYSIGEVAEQFNVEKGFTLNGAKEMLKQDSLAVKDKMEMIDSLRKIRKFLTEVRDKIQ